jgi:hypothetical protein
MGKTFKYGYVGRSFRNIDRHAEQKVGHRRSERRAFKSFITDEINEIYYNCNKFETNCNVPYNFGRITKPNATGNWYNSNSNIEWKIEDDKLIGDTGVNITNVGHVSDNKDYAYNVVRSNIDKTLDRIGKKQLKRRNEIGKKSIINRHDDYKLNDLTIDNSI